LYKNRFGFKVKRGRNQKKYNWQFHNVKGGADMTLEIIRDTLAWCAVINIVLLVLWILFFMAGRGWIYRMHSRWFNLSEEKFDVIHYSGMALFKIGIWLFLLGPYLALRIVG
jgi:hypothetical protein